MWREEQSQRTKEAYKVEHKKCGSSSASGIQVTEGGGGLEGGREGAFFAAVLFPLPPCGVYRSPGPSVYKLQTQKKEESRAVR